MKLKTKKIITLISFILCAVISVVALILFASNSHVTEHGGKTVYASTELIQMKRGEKLSFSEANEYFEPMKKKYNKTFQVHSQGAYSLSVNELNNNPDHVSSMIYIDKDGYINAVKTGVYQLEYTFAIGEHLGETEENYNKEGYEAFTFTALVCVYEGDEDKFEPLPDDPWSLSTKNESNPGNYILTKDITWKADSIWTVSNFYGTLINPNGYTLTWDIGTEIVSGGKRRIEALFGYNYGYIDGLKVKVVGGEDAPIEIGDFHGLVERNNGVLQNCKIEGVVKMSERETNYDPDYFYALPKHGFSFNNEARMTVYSNNEIYAYDTEVEYSGSSNFAERLWQSKNNKVYLDAWYYQDDIKAQRREVKTILPTERDSNSCEHLILGKESSEKKTVTLQIPITMERVGEPVYKTVKWTSQGNTPLAIDDEYWSYVRWGGYSDGERHYENLEVKYWLVNGKKVDTLNEVVINEDVVIEPFVQYKETKYAIWTQSEKELLDIFNTDAVIDLSGEDFSGEIPVETKMDRLGYIFADPRSVKPTTIILGENIKVSPIVDEENEKYLNFLLDFLQNGGQLIVNGTNPYVSFIDNKYFCNADGTSLYLYFEGNDETEVTLHPQITEIIYENAFWNGSKYEKLYLSNVEQLHQKLGDDLTTLKEIYIGKELDVITGGHSSDTIYNFLSRIPTLEKVEVDEGHLKLKAEDNFVWNGYSVTKQLLFAPATLEGEVKVPEGPTMLRDGCFMGSNITHLILPDSLTQFKEESLRGMKKLEKITFGASQRIADTTSNSVELPALKILSFNDVTEELNFGAGGFSESNLERIILPKNMSLDSRVTFQTKAYQVSEESPIWKTLDGVLYNKTNNVIAQYPKYKVGDSYTVLDGTPMVGKMAFYETELKTVILPGTCVYVSDYAFKGSKIESVEFKAKSEIALHYEAFYGCEKLTTVDVQENVELYIGEYAFRGCAALKEFPYENVTHIGHHAFADSGIEYFEIVEEVTWLGYSAFEKSQLKNVVIKTTSIDGIQGSMFKETPLESVELSSSILYINGSVFENCKNLKEIDLKNVKTIDVHAFRESGIQSIESTTVETISEGAFMGCKELTYVSLPNVISVPLWAFAGSGVVGVYMTNVLKVDDGAFEECVDLTSVQFKDKVSVGSQSFMNCKNLTELSFTITGVDIQSFEGCSSLKEVTIDANIEDRCVRVFADCTALEEVTITGENLAIGAEFFAGCTSLKKVFITDTGADNSVILTSAFGTASQNIEVYLDVPETFLWKGKVPANVTVYVPEEYAEKFVSEWLAEEGQILGFNFKETV